MHPAVAILAHRANVSGPSGALENSYGLCAHALSLGFGLEIDLRRSPDGRFYFAHDLTQISPASELTRFTPLFHRTPPQTIAVNVKELGYETELIDLSQKNAFGQEFFYFDFELLEPEVPGHAQRVITLHPAGKNVPLAARISDRAESVERCLAIPSQVVWADEFDRDWLDREVIDVLKAAGRRVYVVSPELHGRDKKARLARWSCFREWRVDGVCTDYSIEASSFFNR